MPRGDVLAHPAGGNVEAGRVQGIMQFGVN